MDNHFFMGFADELLKVAGPLDWIKKKLGMGVVKAPPPKFKPGSGYKPPSNLKAGQTAIQQQQKKTYGGVGSTSSQKKALGREGVFGM